MSFVNRSRRLGQRLPVNGIVVAWDTRGRRKPGLLRRPFATADVIDVSVSGVQFLAPSDDRMTEDRLVTICGRGAIGTVRVRRVLPVTNGRLSVFGVEIVALEAALEECLFARIGENRPQEVERYWQRIYL